MLSAAPPVIHPSSQYNIYFFTNCVSIMKNLIHLLPILISGVLVLLLSSCIQDKCEQSVTYITLTPEYISFEDFRTEPITSVAARELEAPGKMYFYNDFIFISELNEGIHILDNSNPSNPQRVSFITIPGNRDLAGKRQYAVCRFLCRFIDH